MGVGEGVLVECDGEWYRAVIGDQLGDGRFLVTYEDQSSETVASERVAKDDNAEPNVQTAQEEPLLKEDATSQAPAKHTPAKRSAPAQDDDIDALMAAAAAAGALDDANDYVAGALPPSKQHWNKALLSKDQESTEEMRERIRPVGLMSSQKAQELCRKKAKM